MPVEGGGGAGCLGTLPTLRPQGAAASPLPVCLSQAVFFVCLFFCLVVAPQGPCLGRGALREFRVLVPRGCPGGSGMGERGEIKRLEMAAGVLSLRCFLKR